VVDLHAHQAVSRARMAEDRQRAARARQRPQAARGFWQELQQRMSRSRDTRRTARLRRAA